MEYAFDAEFAIVKAWKGDTAGNLIYRSTARNFNPMMAMAGKITIAEVEELVPAGQLPPDQIHTPGIYVHRIFQGEKYEKRIACRGCRRALAAGRAGPGPGGHRDPVGRPGPRRGRRGRR